MSNENAMSEEEWAKAIIDRCTEGFIPAKKQHRETHLVRLDSNNHAKHMILNKARVHF